MKLNIGVCDDEKEQLSLITEYINKFEISKDVEIQVSCFDSAEALLLAYSTPGFFHILFLDVEMTGMNGIELANTIRQMPDKEVNIIFVSNYPEYMQSSFNVQAFHYLSKPLKYDDFSDIMQRIITDYEERNTYKVLVQTDGEEVLVNIHDILYVETTKFSRNSLCYHLAQNTIESRGTIADIEHSLSEHNFALASRGILVNLSHIRALRQNTILLDNDATIPMSRRCEKDIHKKFSSKVITFMN